MVSTKYFTAKMSEEPGNGLFLNRSHWMRLLRSAPEWFWCALSFIGLIRADGLTRKTVFRQALSRTSLKADPGCPRKCFRIEAIASGGAFQSKYTAYHRYWYIGQKPWYENVVKAPACFADAFRLHIFADWIQIGDGSSLWCCLIASLAREGPVRSETALI